LQSFPAVLEVFANHSVSQLEGASSSIFSHLESEILNLWPEAANEFL